MSVLRKIRQFVAKAIYAMSVGSTKVTTVTPSGAETKVNHAGSSSPLEQKYEEQKSYSGDVAMSVQKWNRIIDNMVEDGIEPVPIYVTDPISGLQNFVRFEFREIAK